MTSDRTILVVCGLAAEARIAAGPDVVCLAASPSTLPARLEAAARSIRPAAVVSFGLCGGLAPQARAGTIVLATSVVYEAETWHCDRDFVLRLRMMAARAGRAAVEGPIAGSRAPVPTTAEKGRLHRETGAVAVDTESHLAAAFAARLGMPFCVVRAVCDAAGNDLPPLAINATDADGRLDWKSIGREIAARPGQLLSLPGTALATAVAMRSLRRVRRLLGPRFGF